MNSSSTLLAASTVVSIALSFAGSITLAQRAPLADHHAHLQSPAAARLLNQGATDKSHNSAEEEKPSLASELIAQLDAAHIRRAVALSDAYRLGSPFVHVSHEAAAVNSENDWTLQQVQLYSDRLVGFCSVNPIRPYALAAIHHCASIGLTGGLKLHLANAKFNFDDPAQIRQLRAVFTAADRLRMPILIHLRSGETWNGPHSVAIFMDQVLPAAAHVPVQVAHLGGWGGYDRPTDETLSAFVEQCKAHPDRCSQIYFDISAVVLSSKDAQAIPGSDARLLWDEQKDFADGPDRLAANLRRIGLARILFATDWPNATSTEYIAELRHRLQLTPAETSEVLGNVAPYLAK